MTNVIMVHGTYGSPDENWFPWLKEELEGLGCTVYTPKFPTPEGQSLRNWLEVFRGYEKYMGDDTIVVGHSIAPAFLLTVLETHKAKAAFFVSGFVGALNSRFDELNGTIADKVFDWDSIKRNCRRFYAFYSDNDPFVPMEKLEGFARLIGAQPIVVSGAGHFLKETGYVKFDLLLEKIRGEL